jgi:hypothetical protein
MALYALDEFGTLVHPVLVVAFDGWVNAGEAGTTAAEAIAEGGDVIARFDSDSLYDYRAVRPTVDFLEGVMSEIEWPEMMLRRRGHGGRDFIVLTGIEPNWQWQALAGDIAELAIRLGIEEHVSLGGIPWAAPHTRPVTTIVTASDRARLDPSGEHPHGLLRVPGSAVSIVEHAVASQGIPTMGFWARVPHYIGAAYPAAAIALVEQVATHLGVDLPLGELPNVALEQAEQLDGVAAGRPEVQAMVEQLETLVDQQGAVSGEDLAAEIERYLRERDSDT